MNFLNPNSNYELLVNNVPRVDDATGGLLQNSPIVCGGENEMGNTTQDCFVIGKAEMRMIEKRSNAVSVALDQRTLWIVGGTDEGYNGMSSTELIKLGQPSVKGPKLPFRISAHSMIQYDEKSIYIIGGIQNGRFSSKKTWIVDPTDEFQIKEGPTLNKGRHCHGCAKMSLNGRTILVVAGGYGEDYEVLDSVEILDPSGSNVWTQGLYLKYVVVEFCLKI